MDIRSIASLVGNNKIDRKGISSFLRDNIRDNPRVIESLADEIYRTSPHPDERNNRLSSLRMLMRNVCDELELPKHTVVRRGTVYRLEKSTATIRSTSDPLNPSVFRPLRKAAEKASTAEKELILATVMKILGIERGP